MVYAMLEESYKREDQVEYCITLAVSRFSDLHPTENIHNIAAIRGRFYANDREIEL